VAFLWFADRQPLATNAIWLAVLTLGLWATGAVLQGRYPMRELLLIECAALATASGALGLAQVHYVFKPLTLLIAMTLVATDAPQPGADGSFKTFLLLALGASLIGDVLLMLRGQLFLAGLAAFLLAHLFYIVLLQRSTGPGRWFPSRVALAATLLYGAAMVSVLWSGLRGAVLTGAVAAYVVVIALMAAQAIGRAAVLRNRAATLVAVGACFFMLSDTLLAINRFVQPLPMVGLWVLGTYYVAQILIARKLLKKA
jgi:uncharacterized membrane protein YhhN